MSAWLAVGILSGFVVAGALIRMAADITRKRLAARLEPENSLPGKVLPHGVPLVRALKEARTAKSELGDRRAPGEGPPTEACQFALIASTLTSRFSILGSLGTMSPAGPDGGGRETSRKRFSEGQWLRRKGDGRLMMHIRESCLPGHFWASLDTSAGDMAPALCWDLEFEAAVPRDGEWWRITRSCCGAEIPPWDGFEIRSSGALCTDCFWEPVNFGLGHGELTSAYPPSRGHFKVASCRDCGEVLGVVGNAGRGALFTHCGVSTYDVTITALTRPMAGEGWRLDSCVKGHRFPEYLPDLSKTGEYGYDEAGMFFLVKADWGTGLGVAAALLCGCLRRVPDVTRPDRMGNLGPEDRRGA